MDHLCYLYLVFVMLSRLFIAALWSPTGKEQTSWLLFVMFNCVFVTFPCGKLGQVWYLIVSVPDLCRISYFDPLTGNLLDRKSKPTRTRKHKAPKKGQTSQASFGQAKVKHQSRVTASLTHLSRMEFPNSLSTEPVQIVFRVADFNILLYRQTVETHDQTRRLIFIFTVCLCPTKRMLCLYGLKYICKY